MLRNPNAFVKKVQAHIIDCLGYPWDTVKQAYNEEATIAERLRYVACDFHLWKSESHYRSRRDRITAFVEYSKESHYLRTKTTWGDRKAELQKWYEWSDEEAATYCRESVDYIYLCSICLQFIVLCDSFGIEF